ncbi:type IV toxin-antitoxin system AbiEi family antitoxin domain-containing protein [Knoellia subterranea]|uniref:AbiEi antitoxin N-terminal domain-containing protein n=1 Tax=Knoellia subterranea KCTC 19937 TaxID=1385521 RepID=A0A0A0JT65_9MICO|nr:type IV toxin-antitoxin system AbiEi family antitoxin domain-containing protein [Knoellia subterranea]KGN39272.1 hypothetical protein N803_01980 [Knoellia subterranea KCTC 19937]
MVLKRRQTYRDTLREIAAGDYGLITLRDAEALGVPAVEVRKLASRGFLERVGHGLYRDPTIPPSDMDQFAWAARAVGDDAYLMGESVLAMHNLGFVNPARITVGTPRRVWRALPAVIHAVTRKLPPDALTVEEGVAQTTIYQALIDCLPTVMTSRLRDAVTEAGRRGLLTKREQSALRARISRRSTEMTR